jgi:hypothetical protein
MNDRKSDSMSRSCIFFEYDGTKCLWYNAMVFSTSKVRLSQSLLLPTQTHWTEPVDEQLKQWREPAGVMQARCADPVFVLPSVYEEQFTYGLQAQEFLRNMSNTNIHMDINPATRDAAIGQSREIVKRTAGNILHYITQKPRVH